MSPTPKTLIYKSVDSLDIPLDIYLPTDSNATPAVLLWFHGGGLLQGHRARIAPHFLRSVDRYNIALISADYRLAPQVGVQEIFEDVQDCIAFIRSPEGLVNQLPHDTRIDTTRLAVSGSSAGGYLAFLAGLYADPIPDVILPIYPITDPLGYFFATPQPGPILRNGEVSETSPEDALRAMREDGNAAYLPVEFLDRSAEVMANNAPDSARNRMYGYMLASASLAELLHLNTSETRYREPENDRWRIARSVAKRGLPPTYVVHGDIDRAVGVDQSDEVVGVCVGERVEVVYERLRGKDHLYDMQDASEEMEGMYSFMMKHLSGPSKAEAGKL